MITLLTLLLAPTAPAMLLSYVCEADEGSAVPRYELMLAAGMVRARWVSPDSEFVAQEASKVLTASEVAGLRRAVSDIPGPFSNYDPSRARRGGHASLAMVSGANAWNVTYAAFDPRWRDFAALITWIKRLHETDDLRALRFGLCVRG